MFQSVVSAFIRPRPHSCDQSLTQSSLVESNAKRNSAQSGQNMKNEYFYITLFQ